MPAPSVTISEAARRLGVSTKTVRRRIATGEIEAHKASGPGGFQYRVTDPAVLALPIVQASLPTPSPRAGHADARAWTSLVEGLTARLVEEREARVRAEWERDQLRQSLPAPAT